MKKKKMININRLTNHLQELAVIGKTKDGGINRFSYTDEEKCANEQLEQYMKAAGLSVEYDAIGNLIGSTKREEGLPVILIGSHIDTVPNGEKYDGSLGVLTAIEVIHSLKENNIRLKHPLKVIAFKDEEGTRFGYGMIGSRAVAGTLTEEDLKRKDQKGISIEQAINQHGFNKDRLQSAKLENVKCYMEVHIEQGKVLEHQNAAVGCVTGITGPVWLQFTLSGLAEHAGATPMDQRQDALVGASLIIAEAEKIAKEYPSAVATVGQLSIKPNGVNVIPGEVTWTFDIRDIDEDIRDQVERRIKQFSEMIAAERRLGLEVLELQRVAPLRCDQNIQEVIKDCIRKINEPVISLPSGAGHDGMQFKDLFPVGMIFVRSKDGISHNPKEFSSEQDIEKAAKVLYQSILKLDSDK
ncbi:Zn-dependent hydrolase [Bacillus glycinifermentans]|uniref:Zn-dependent hydrolase n=2 Tax=Bacillus TaxID=1386 RepID=UPI0028F8F46D|nr:Zn-dependent hydrolase [Bacillus glycinifermentans]MDU0070723.1 Zn-dependent hydrolase [Bacillus sp. IG6]MED8018705.1 Zn-dependent hydrolase [Bacillus glycinifermentans]